MDALKKAEEEKKQAAKRLQEVEVDARDVTNENSIPNDEQITEEERSEPDIFLDTAKLSLEPLQLDQISKEIEETVPDVDKEIIDESHIQTVDAAEAFSEDLTLENTVSEGMDLQESFEETQKEIDLNDTTIIEGLSTENASAPFDDTFHGVLFEEQEQDTEIYEETLPGVPADQLIKDLGGGEFQPTPVAAKTVFTAGRSNKKQNSFKWGIFVVLAIMAIGSFAIFYYFTITPVSRNLPSPLIARGVESAIVAPPAITPPSEPEVVTETIISSVVEEPQAEIVEETFEAQPMFDETVSKLDVSNQTEMSAPIIEEIEQVELFEASESRHEEVVSVDEAADSNTAEKSNEALIVEEFANVESNIDSIVEQAPENVQVDSSLITISKADDSEQKNVMVSQAFKAYRDGHYDAAKSIYESVLKEEPDNRDAHLGLGAIAINNNDRKNAYSHYVHLLELNPDDPLALNALIGLSNNADLVKDESAIKLLIQKEGNVPYLYFSLGNLYAKQQRWASAQQAFFDAYRLDTTNPDYVINLAISLDQLGQHNAALDYYKTAIELSKISSTRFDTVSVNSRILALSKVIE
jgi:tetratricopeptide (TPR) repeat protein